MARAKNWSLPSASPGARLLKTKLILAWIRPSVMASWTVERRARDPGPRPVENQPRLSIGPRGSVTSLELH